MRDFTPGCDFRIRKSGTLCRIVGLLALAGAMALPGCAGEVITDDGDSGDGDRPSGDGDDPQGDGDRYLGDGDYVGDGDYYGDGDVQICTADFRYGITATVYGGRAVDGDSFGVPFEPEVPVEILPPLEDPVELPPLEPPPMGGASGTSDECGVSVFAVDGDYREELSCSLDWNGGDHCVCYGAGERPGTYTVTAFYSWGEDTRIVELGSDGCHVEQVQLYFGIVR